MLPTQIKLYNGMEATICKPVGTVSLTTLIQMGGTAQHNGSISLWYKGGKTIWGKADNGLYFKY